MKLTRIQKEFYRTNGYLIIENLLAPEDVYSIKSRIPDFNSKKDLPNVICEDEDNIRSVFAPHHHDEIFERLYRDERLANPSKELVGEDIYLYQYKLNQKRAFHGKMWEWHQDFPYWKLDDGVESPDMISLMIYLDSVKSYQGPLMIIPQSHINGVSNFQEKPHLMKKDNLINSLGVDLKYTVDKVLVKKLADKHKIKVLEAKSGTGIFFHPNLYHASTGNLSPYERDTIIITYNSIHNAPKTKMKRPEYICSTNYEAILPTKLSAIAP